MIDYSVRYTLLGIDMIFHHSIYTDYEEAVNTYHVCVERYKGLANFWIEVLV